MIGRFQRVATAILQIAGLVVFSAAAPLAHLHPSRGDGDHGITFHAHLDEHESLPHSDAPSESHQDALDLANGRVESPRLDWQLLAVAPSVAMVSPPPTPFLDVPNAPFESLRPPLLFRRPVRGPPSSF